jgi:hypothetical protein
VEQTHERRKGSNPDIWMTTKPALIDIMLQQRETINWLRAYDRSIYEISREAITRHQEERDYWKVRCAAAEDDLINIKLFGKL